MKPPFSFPTARCTGSEIQQILDLGKDLLRFPIEPLPDVVEVLTELKQRGHRLLLLTKGDLFDQESKVARSGLGDFFDHVEIVSEKDEPTYRRLFARLGIRPDNFVMIGNSLKSDILPVAKLGFPAIHVPYHANWIHEHVPAELLAGWSFGRWRGCGRCWSWWGSGPPRSASSPGPFSERRRGAFNDRQNVDFRRAFVATPSPFRRRGRGMRR